MSLYWTAWLRNTQTRLNTIKILHFKPATVSHLWIILLWEVNAYNLQEIYTCHSFDPTVIIPEGELVCPANFIAPMRKTSY